MRRRDLLKAITASAAVSTFSKSHVEAWGATESSSRKGTEVVKASDAGVLPDSDPSKTVAAINRALRLLGSKGGGVFLFDKTNGWYNIDSPMIMVDGVSLSGDTENRPRIRNVRQTYDFLGSSCLSPGNFHPSYMSQFKYIAIHDVSDGDEFVTLKSGVNSGVFAIGDSVLVASNDVYHSSNFPINEFLFLNEVTKIDREKIYLKYALDKNFSGSLAKVDGMALGRGGNPLNFWKRGSVENLILQTDGYLQSDSATLDCHFSNLKVDAKSIFYGNTFQRTTWKNIVGVFSYSVGELSLCSYRTVVDGVALRFSQKAGVKIFSGISFQENARLCVFRNAKIDFGECDTGNPLLSFINAQDCLISDVDIAGCSKFRGAVIQMANSINAVGRLGGLRNKVERVDFRGEQAARFTYIAGDVSDSTIENSRFSGNLLSKENSRFSAVKGKNFVQNNMFASGKPNFSGSSDQIFLNNGSETGASGPFRK